MGELEAVAGGGAWGCRGKKSHFTWAAKEEKATRAELPQVKAEEASQWAGLLC